VTVERRRDLGDSFVLRRDRAQHRWRPLDRIRRGRRFTRRARGIHALEIDAVMRWNAAE
jgi:hypothetical protein